jgi:hypothetical protein
MGARNTENLKQGKGSGSSDTRVGERKIEKRIVQCSLTLKYCDAWRNKNISVVSCWQHAVQFPFAKSATISYIVVFSLWLLNRYMANTLFAHISDCSHPVVAMPYLGKILILTCFFFKLNATITSTTYWIEGIFSTFKNFIFPCQFTSFPHKIEKSFNTHIKHIRNTAIRILHFDNIWECVDGL